MVGTTKTRFIRLASLAVLATALAGCSSPAAPTLSASDASAKYQPVMDALVETLSSEFAAPTWATDPDKGERILSGGDDEPCGLWLANEVASESLPQAAGDWSAVMDAINPVLEDNGFDKITDTEDMSGPGSAIASTDDAGARILIADLNPTVITLEIHVTDTGCRD